MGAATGFSWSLKALILTLICILSFSIRLFSVVKYESVIHEFDPYFNYRVTQYLTKEGYYNLWNWFDDQTWYPLGRIIGGTVYPGLIFTAGSIYNVLHFLNVPIHVQEVCVFTAPLFSSFCSLASYGLVNEVRGEAAGLIAATMVGIVPSYLSRSVAGSFDNEGVAIFALVFVFYMFVKTLNTGRVSWCVGLLLAYWYMVMSWGGYSFIINLLPLYCLLNIVTGRLTARLYVAFAPLVFIGTLMAASIPVVGFNAVLMSEHFGAFFACGVLHVALFVRWAHTILPPKVYAAATAFALASGGSLIALGLGVAILYVMNSPTFGWTGRSMTLLDPTYASRFVPIIASVSEHQPPSWTSYVMDLHIAALLAPAGILAAFQRLNDASVFLVLYGVTAVYFSGVMVRLMLVLAPVACCLTSIALSDALLVLGASLKAAIKGPAAAPAVTPGAAAAAAAAQPQASGSESAEGSKEGKKEGRRKKGSSSDLAKEKDKAKDKAKDKDKDKDKDGGLDLRWGKKRYPVPYPIAMIGMGIITMILILYALHCVYVSAEMYSAPSIVLQGARGPGGGRPYVFDDFREAYAWLRHNTKETDVVASWWDYGYQTTAMANRTVVVDNNTWNTTHIATVGRAMSSPEKKAWQIYRSLDVEYVFVVFGGLIGYPSDDINKFLWMVRIGGGVYPEIQEPDYLTPQGEYRVDGSGSATMLNSLMYKLTYYKFAEATSNMGAQPGFDRVRNAVIGKLHFSLRHFEEVFTSDHWMMRIYRVKQPPNRGYWSKRKPVKGKGKAS